MVVAVGKKARKSREPKHIKDAKSSALVQNLALSGVTQEVCAKAMGISVDTIQKHYSDEWKQGAIIATAKVARSLYEHAVSGDPKSLAAAIFWMKTRGGWKENQIIEANITVPTLQLVAASSVPDMPPALVKTLKALAD